MRRGLALAMLAWGLVGCGGGGEVAGAGGPSASVLGLGGLDEAVGLTVPALVRSGSPDRKSAQAVAAAGDPLRSRDVVLDLAALAQASPGAPRDAASRGLLRIDFFGDLAVIVRLTAAEPTRGGGWAYTGVVPGDPTSQVVVVDNGGTVSVGVRTAQGHFTLQGDPVAGYQARQEPALEPADDTLPPDLTAIDRQAQAARKRAQAEIGAADDGSVVDVMVVYTAAARQRFGGGNAAQMAAIIDAQVAQTNAMYANSQVIQRLRLVYAGEIELTEGDLLADLQRLQQTTDGAMDRVHVLRDLYGADIVTLWGSYTGQTTGIGFIMDVEQASFGEAAFNALWLMQSGSNTFAHELGHNMGLRHDRAQDTTRTQVTPAGSTTLTAIDYAHGYLDTRNRFVTVMSYASSCQPIFCASIPYFSNPSVSFDNRSFYAGAVPAPTGDALSDEARALNDTRETVANFRPSAASFTGPGVLVAIPRGSPFASESAASITIDVERHLGSTGAVTVNYATLAGTATAGADYTPISGTLSWAAGDTSRRTLTLPLLGDAVSEPNETLQLVLSSPTGGASVGRPGGSSQALALTLLDDDPDAFPDGCGRPAGWTTSGSLGWDGASDQFLTGPCSLKSATAASPAGARAQSSLEATLQLQAGELSFNTKVAVPPGVSCSGVLFFIFSTTGSFNDSAFIPCATAAAADVAALPWVPTRIAIPAAGRYSLQLSFVHLAGSGAAAWVDGMRLPVATAGAPQSVQARPGLLGGSAVLAFTPPANAAATGVTGYTASCSASGQSARSATGAASPLLVTGLSGGVAHACTVVANNAGGAGTASTPATVTPLAAGQDLSADLGGDRKADLLWQNTATGERAAWYLDAGRYIGGAGLGSIPTDWQMVGVGDFNADGQADIVWQNASSGERTIWLMSGATLLGGLPLGVTPTAWQIAATGDFNGDGRSDLVWQNTTTGERAVWLLEGGRLIGGGNLGVVPVEWKIVGTGDFDGDGKTDLLWENTSTGERYLWYLDGTRLLGGARLSVTPTEWTIARVADFNGDGKPDLAWQNTRTGERALWYLDGLRYIGGVNLGVVPVAWQMTR